MNQKLEVKKIKSIKRLLQTHSLIIDELKFRKVLRTRNNPVADFAEWLVAKSLGFSLENNSKAGFDALDKKNVRYQIKGRRITPENKSTQLGVIRNLDKKLFDFLIGVVLDENFDVLYVAQIPHSVVVELAQFKKYQNGHILHLRRDLLDDKRVQDLTGEILSKF